MPARQLCSSRFERSTCSRLPSGSASIPTRPSRLETVPSISSRIASSSVSHERVGACKRADHVQRHARLGAGRVERHLGSVPQRLDPLRADPRALQAPLPGLGGFLRELVRCLARVARGRLVDPGSETRGREVGEREREVAHVPLGVEDQGGDPLRERLLEQHDPEAGLAGAGHADDHRMGGEVVGVEGELAAVEELAELKPRCHGASLPRSGDARRAGRGRASSRPCETLGSMQRRPEQEQLVAALVCLECGDTSDEAAGWRAYRDEDELLVYCTDCAAREFDS